MIIDYLLLFWLGMYVGGAIVFGSIMFSPVEGKDIPMISKLWITATWPLWLSRVLKDQFIQEYSQNETKNVS